MAVATDAATAAVIVSKHDSLCMCLCNAAQRRTQQPSYWLW